MGIAQDQKPGFRQVTEQLFAPISVNASGDNTVVAAVPGFYIRVIKWAWLCNAAVIVTWKSSIAGAITGPQSFAQNGGRDSSESPAGIVQTARGEALVCNLNGAVTVGGELTYMLVSDYPGVSS